MNRLEEIFSLSESYPLIFTQVNFWIFFAIVYFIFALVYEKISLRNSYLFFISLFFYYKTSGLFVGILLFSTLVDFIIGKKIYKTEHQKKRYFLVTLSVCINLLVL
ncbi:MAG: MBOAT family protein, partial [Polaribacter sp.]|nr:MBOAT family protein [Polaribacter sp.]